MIVQVRPCINVDEMREAMAPIWHYFGQNTPSDDAIRHFHRVLAPERVHAGFDGEKIVSGSGSFPFDLTIPGGHVKAAGVTITGVLPTHRRRGYLSAMMRSLIDAARAGGEAIAVLWATEDAIYGRFGYGMASMAAEIDMPRDRAAPFAAVDVPGETRLVPLAEAEPLIAPIYDRVARVTPACSPARRNGGRTACSTTWSGSAGAADIFNAWCWRSAAVRPPMRSIA